VAGGPQAARAGRARRSHHPRRGEHDLAQAHGRLGLLPGARKVPRRGKPIFGTCAGLILLARDVERPPQRSLGFIDITAERNAYGRQKESFETEVTADLGSGPAPLKVVFIRAPRIRRLGPAVTPLVAHQGECIMARQGTVLVAAFHPELTDDDTVHRYFSGMTRSAGA
jgi:pyridoxal 5'-phosphate synthase pdxT subunit